MTPEEVGAVRHRGQITNEKDQADYVMLLGANLAGFAHLPLTVRNCLMMGSAALNCLPATAEESIAGLMVPLADANLERLNL